MYYKSTFNMFWVATKLYIFQEIWVMLKGNFGGFLKTCIKGGKKNIALLNMPMLTLYNKVMPRGCGCFVT